jgi:sigma-B regulation protein RsbU (phosphoserine phosphatase)
MGQVQMRASALASAIEVLPLQESDLDALIASLVESNERVYGSTIAFEPYALDPARADAAPYVHRAAGGLRRVDLATPEYQYRNQDWYRIPRDSGRARWSEPYFDAGGGDIWMITYSAPFHARNDPAGGVRGVVTADLSLGWLRNMLDHLQVVEGGSAFLLSPGGLLVSHLDPRGAGPSVEGGRLKGFVEAGERMGSGARAALRMPGLEGEPVYLSYRALGAEGWKLGLVSPESAILAPARRLLEIRLLFGALAVLALLLAVSVLAGRITHPLGALAGAVRRIGAGDLEIALPPVHGEDELAVLNNAVARMRTDLKGLIEQRAQAAAAQERLARDLEIARRIQQSMLPRPWQGGDRARFSVAAVLRPAREVGGDLYDFFELEDGRLLFAVGDVSDKGIPAALFMAEASAVLGAIARSGQPAESILAKLDERLSHDNEAAMFLTMWCGALDGETGRLEYASAGHEPPLVRRAGGGVTALADDSGPALGFATGGPFAPRTTYLAPGDSLVLCTDGVTEAFGAGGEAFGVARLTEIVDREAPEAVPDKVVQEVERFSHADYPLDDVTVLAIAFRGVEVELIAADPEEWRFAMPAQRSEVVRLMARLQGMLRARQVPEEAVADCLLIAEEVLVNVALYAYREDLSRRALLEARLCAGEVRLRFVDDGPPYDPLSRPDPDLDLPIAERPVGGLGVYLVKQLASESEYSHDDGRNILTVTRRWSTAAVA